jgi:hypothetical protein
VSPLLRVHPVTVPSGVFHRAAETTIKEPTGASTLVGALVPDVTPVATAMIAVGVPTAAAAAPAQRSAPARISEARERIMGQNCV